MNDVAKDPQSAAVGSPAAGVATADIAQDFLVERGEKVPTRVGTIYPIGFGIVFLMLSLFGEDGVFTGPGMGMMIASVFCFWMARDRFINWKTWNPYMALCFSPSHMDVVIIDYSEPEGPARQRILKASEIATVDLGFHPDIEDDGLMHPRFVLKTGDEIWGRPPISRNQKEIDKLREVCSRMGLEVRGVGPHWG